MTKPTMPDAESAIWDEVMFRLGRDVRERVAGPDLEAFCGQVARLREAQKRIAAEGLIIADPKGFPMPHPAIAIERAAQIEIRAWGSRFEAPASSGRGGAPRQW